MASAWRNFKNIFFTICTCPNGPARAKFLQRFQFEGKTDVGISQVRRVKHEYFLIFCENATTFFKIRMLLHKGFQPIVQTTFEFYE